MKIPQTTSPLDDHKQQILKLVDQNYSNRDIARLLTDQGQKTSEVSVRRALKRWNIKRTSGPESPGLNLNDNTAEITSKPVANEGSLPNHEDLITERGLDPLEWEVTNMTINEYEGAPAKADQKNGDTDNRKYRQIKIVLRRRMAYAFPKPADREPGSYIKQTKKRLPKPLSRTNTGLVVFTGDQQAPFHDEDLHEAFCEWLGKNKPERGVLIGDTVDFPDISRHRLNPEDTASVQECINAGYNLLRDYVEASPDTEWTKLAGNHDERIRNTLIDQAVGLYGVKRAEIDGTTEPSVLSISHLMRLDELGIEFVEPAGGYAHCQVNVSPHLAARHGWLAGKGAGASALKTLEHLGYSVVVGHTHRQGLVHKTTHDINGTPSTLAAVETGCMCRIQSGLGYAVNPDWQNGFATAQVWDDGKFKLDLATYVSNVLMWRDQRYG